MLIQTALPLAFSHIGQRQSNQDALYPALGAASEQTDLFIVCDGMGGLDKGDVASQLLSNAVANYMSGMGFPILDSVHMQTAINQAYSLYYTYLKNQPLVGRMGSTMACVQLNERGVTVANIGDSRVYQIRNGQVIFRTQDHRQVNEMVEAGIITPEQIPTHPWRNRLSRSVTASLADADGQTSRSLPDVVLLTDIQAGDYFFMCTDGVLERLDDYLLTSILAEDVPNQTKMQAIQSLCEGQTKDNYSAYLIGIQYVTKPAERV
ncbi:serine/threonine-protein phosphatase [Spirosoma sp. BT702]|uniref:Serine/threonine-protein phosphatase n=1 Tax=Spirosoma profusum TaxID=2771354 RepID=A0A927APY7_9BACT|nr:protein phosphatase 2C domain-containing protein [Spirosoma profusum]MBD2699296.1 serine/threonine-protein phosphatase [Spirosoma profusum]